MLQWYQCPNCGAPLAFGARFCGNCGTQIEWPTQQQARPHVENDYLYQIQKDNYDTLQHKLDRTRSWLNVVIVIMVLLIIGIGALSYHYFSNLNSDMPLTTAHEAQTSNQPEVEPNEPTPPPQPAPTPAPSIPSLIRGMRLNNVTDSSAEVTWSTPNRATCQLEYGLNATYGASITSVTESGFDHKASLTNLEPDTIYHFRIIAKFTDDSGEMSDDFEFPTYCTDVDIENQEWTYLEPLDGAIVPCGVPITFRWPLYSGGYQDGFQFEISECEDVGAPLVSTTVGDTKYQYYGTLKCNTTYYWRVMVKGTWGPVFRFTPKD